MLIDLAVWWDHSVEKLMTEQILPENDLNRRVASDSTKTPTERVEKPTVPPAPVRSDDPDALRQDRADHAAEDAKYSGEFYCC